MKYNVDFFISKFQNTREDKWCIHQLHVDGKSCANGWCGVTSTSNGEDGQTFLVTFESQALAVIFSCLATKTNKDYDPRYSTIAADINNGFDERYTQLHPKQRILAALHDIKKMQDGQATPVVEIQPPVKVITKYVGVPESLVQETTKLILS